VRRHRLAATVLVATAIALSVTGCNAKAGIPDSGALIGASAGTRNGVIDLTVALANREKQVGYRFGAHRIFQPPQSTFTLTDETVAELNDDAAKGRTSYLSVHVPIGQTWDSFASHTAELNSLSQRLAQFTHPIVFILEHEPDVTAHQNGTVAGYSQLMTAIFTSLRTYAPKVSTSVVFGYYKVWSGQITTTALKSYLPADRTLLDIIAVDPFDEARNPAGAVSFQTLVAPFLTMATQENKPLEVYEVGTSYAGSDRGQWIIDMDHYVQANTRIKAVIWFDTSTNAGDPTHDFWLDGDGSETYNNAPVLRAFALVTSAAFWHKAAG
jgi:hypothetical protein